MKIRKNYRCVIDTKARKKRSQPAMMPAKYSEGPTPERMAKGNLVNKITEDGYRQTREKNTSMLEKMFSLKKISHEQYSAACRLKLDYLASRLVRGVKSSLVLEPIGLMSKCSDRLPYAFDIDSKERFDEARFNLTKHDIHHGTKFSAIIKHVVLDELSLKTMTKKAKLVDLRRALDLLANFYRNKYNKGE